jgi:hypothetical protein
MRTLFTLLPSCIALLLFTAYPARADFASRTMDGSL